VERLISMISTGAADLSDRPSSGGRSGVGGIWIRKPRSRRHFIIEIASFPGLLPQAKEEHPLLVPAPEKLGILERSL
jgi:hypothetical protein